MTDELYLEDLAVGQIHRAGPRVVTQEEMITFARDNDPQYFHLDPEAAQDSLFGGLVASGWQTAALTMRLFAESRAPFAKGVVGVGGELQWSAPLRPGDSIRIESVVVEIKRSRSRSDRGIVTIRIKTYNQRDEVVQVLSARLLAFSRDTASE